MRRNAVNLKRRRRRRTLARGKRASALGSVLASDICCRRGGIRCRPRRRRACARARAPNTHERKNTPADTRTRPFSRGGGTPPPPRIRRFERAVWRERSWWRRRPHQRHVYNIYMYTATQHNIIMPYRRPGGRVGGRVGGWVGDIAGRTGRRWSRRLGGAEKLRAACNATAAGTAAHAEGNRTRPRTRTKFRRPRRCSWTCTTHSQ